MPSCIFVRKDKKAFIGFDIKNNKLVLNAVGWNRYAVVYHFDFENEEELSKKMANLNATIRNSEFVAVKPHAFLTGKRYEHFRNKGTLDDTMPIVPENEMPILIGLE